MTLCEGRALAVDVMEDFLSFINGNGALLNNRPGGFNAKDVELYITFTTYYGTYNDVNRLGLLTLRNGITHFFSFSTLDPDRDHWKKRQEYYWQSKMIVDAQRDGEEAYGPNQHDFEAESALSEERLILSE
jgi:hypothetical protein